MDFVWAYVLAIFTAMVLFFTGVALAAGNAEMPSARVEREEAERPGSSSTSTLVAIAIPDVVGQQLRDARTALAPVDSVPRLVKGLATTTEQIDAVIAQDPLPGTVVEPGTEVSLTVARRPEAPLAERATTIAWSEVLTVDVVEAQPGRCSIASITGTGAQLDMVDCSEPHDFEYVAVLPIGDFPSVEIVQSKLTDACQAAVGEYLLAPEASSSLQSTFVWPTLEQWTSGLTTADCLLMTPRIDTQQIVGSAFWSLW